MTIERWQQIPGYEGRYEVSDMGRVRSVARRVRSTLRNGKPGTRITKARILVLHTWGAQYPGIVLVASDGCRERLMVHRIVASVFLPNPRALAIVNHLDGDTMNPSASNLEWCDQSRNIQHSYSLGSRGVGTNHHFSKLPRNEAGHCQSEVSQ